MTESREQQLVDITFQVALMVAECVRKNHIAFQTREDIAAWVADQLKGCGFHTTPCGMSWGVLIKQ